MINDSLGHIAGDELLIHVAQRLRAAVRNPPPGCRDAKHDLIARLGGDEFAILLENVDAEGAIRIADRIQESIHTAFKLETREVFTTASIGIAPGNPGYAHAGRDPARRGYGHVQSQVARQGALRSFRRRHAGPGGGAPGTGERSAPRGRQPGIRAVLSAEGQPEDQQDRGRGGAGEVAPSGARHRSAGPVHSIGRRDRPDRSHRPLGAAGSMRGDAPVAGRVSGRSAA